MEDLPDNHEGRVEKAREILDDSDYQEKVSFLSAVPDAEAATGDHDEVTEKIERWIEENADNEPDLEVVDVDGDDEGDDESDEADETSDDSEETDDLPAESKGAAADGGETVTPDQVDEYEDKAEEAKKRTRHVRDIRDKEHELFFDLAEELYWIREKALYHYVDNPKTGEAYQAMGAYVDEETAHAKRTATYLMGLWEYFVIEHSRGFLERVQHLGWTKLKELVDVIEPDNADKWIAYCESHSFSELQEELKKLGDDDEGPGDEPGPDGDTSRTEKVPFEVKKENIGTVRDAIEVAKTLANTDNKSEAFELMCTEFLSSHQDTLKKDRPLSESLGRVERSFGGEIAFFRRGEDGLPQLIYGREVLHELAEKKKERAKQKAAASESE